MTDLTDFTKSSWTMDDYTDGYFRFQQNGTVFRVKLLYKQRNRNQRNWLKSVKFDFIVLAAQVMEGGKLELVSKELNHFGLIAGLFWQIGGHSSRFVLFCCIKMID